MTKKEHEYEDISEVDLYDEDIQIDTEEEEEKKKKVGFLFILGVLLITMGTSYLGFRIYSHFKSQNMYEEIQEEVNAREIKEKEDFEIEEIIRSLQIYNPDLQGYIYLPHTPLDYPVVQTEKEDGMYYMRRDFANWPSVLGTPFADHRTELNDETDHIVIYGHTADQGHYMFGTLIRYKDPSFLEEHQLIELTTKQELMDYRLVFAISVEADDPEAYLWTQSLDPHEYQSRLFFEDLYNRAYGKNHNYVYDEDHQYLTLVSCEQLKEDQRVVVVYEKINTNSYVEKGNDVLEETVIQTIEDVLSEGSDEGLEHLIVEDDEVYGLVEVDEIIETDDEFADEFNNEFEVDFKDVDTTEYEF